MEKRLSPIRRFTDSAALIDFVEGGGKLGLITNPPNLPRALRGETRTRVIAG